MGCGRERVPGLCAGTRFPPRGAWSWNPRPWLLVSGSSKGLMESDIKKIMKKAIIETKSEEIA
jgi:hypothetical protein